MAIQPAPNLYINVVARINEDYAELIGHLKDMDTRCAYLRSFELTLSSALREPLWQLPEYVRQSAEMPLPSDPYDMLPYEYFRAWLAVYEMIMRDEGLIGRRKAFIIGAEDV